MKNNILSFFSKLYLRFIIFIPISFLMGFTLFYCLFILSNPPSKDIEKTFFGLDILLATFSGLLFYASYATKVIGKSLIYYKEAERFLHSAVRMSIVVFFEACLLSSFFGKNDFVFKEFLIFVMTVFTVIFFVLSMKGLIKGTFNLLNILHETELESK